MSYSSTNRWILRPQNAAAEDIGDSRERRVRGSTGTGSCYESELMSAFWPLAACDIDDFCDV